MTRSAGDNGTGGLFPAGFRTVIVVLVDPHTPAEELPALYRAILDRVAQLEASGERVEAGRVRRNATTAYSRAWDERARRELLGLLREAGRPTAAERRLGRGARRMVPAALGRRNPPVGVSDR